MDNKMQYSYNEIQLSSEKKSKFLTHYNMDESQNVMLNKKRQTQCNTVYESMYVTFQNQMGSYLGPGMGEEDWLQIGTKEFWWRDAGNILGVMVVTQLYSIAKTYQNVHLR